MTRKINTICDFIIREKYFLAVIFWLVTFSTFGFLNLIGIMPSELKASTSIADNTVISSHAETNTQEEVETTLAVKTVQVTHTSPNTAPQSNVSNLPTRIEIDRVGIDVVVSNPKSILIPVLEDALTRGVVRYPEGGTPGNGNMLIIGHSTSYKVVNNQAYKAFNGIKNLAKGDEIVVYSGGKEYIYKVTTIELTTSDKAVVTFGTGKNMLTLVTCNVLGAKEERYLVQADFAGVR